MITECVIITHFRSLPSLQLDKKMKGDDLKGGSQPSQRCSEKSNKAEG